MTNENISLIKKLWIELKFNKLNKQNNEKIFFGSMDVMIKSDFQRYWVVSLENTEIKPVRTFES